MRPAADYVLRRDVCSYGYFLLAPNRWDPDAERLSRPISLPSGRVVVRIDQPGGAPGDALRVACDRRLDRPSQRELRRRIARMLSCNEDLADFYRVDPRWRASGRGRIFRSPTLFEDVVKTVTSCNVTWAGTIGMNERLCEVVDAAFPRPAQLARRRPEALKTRCRVGYRAARLVALGRAFASGDLAAELEDPGLDDEALLRRLRGLPGIGPYAAANILQLLGRYGRLAIDSESLRHAREELGMTGTDGELARALDTHYQRFGGHRFRSYWFELWSVAEARRGPAWSWRPRGEATR